MMPSHKQDMDFSGEVPWLSFSLLEMGDILCNIPLGTRLRTNFSLFIFGLVLEASIVMEHQGLRESD